MVDRTMTPELGDDKGYTPSSAHDSAWKRDDGHDEMQLELYRWLRKQRPDCQTDDRVYSFAGAFAEHHLEVNHRIAGFTDVLASYRWNGSLHGAPRTEVAYRLFEIKPKIHSVGAVIRQLRTLAHLARKALKYDGGYAAAEIEVVAVVPYDDPKFKLLIEMCPYSVWAWDRDLGIPRGFLG